MANRLTKEVIFQRVHKLATNEMRSAVAISEKCTLTKWMHDGVTMISEVKLRMAADEHAENLRKLVNSSGFPLQLRVADEIRRMGHRAWQVIAEEHPWRDDDGDDEGFIDLVVGQNTNHDRHRMVIECKRTRDADWVFLLPDNSDGMRGTQVRCMWVSSYPDNLHEPTGVRVGHHNFYVVPESYISQFCVVRGSGEGHKPMLENLCDGLLRSVESFAREELNLSIAAIRTERRYYVPIVVTTALCLSVQHWVGFVAGG